MTAHALGQAPSNCAQQPTDFWLDTFPIAHVLDTPALSSSLAHYSEQVPALKDLAALHKEGAAPTTSPSLLFLRVQAAASFYTTNLTLMAHPPPVDADISTASPARHLSRS